MEAEGEEKVKNLFEEGFAIMVKTKGFQLAEICTILMLPLKRVPHQLLQ